MFSISTTVEGVFHCTRLAGLTLGVILGFLLGHRRRLAIVVAPMPMRAIWRGQVTV
jgi:hypothetical protein